MSDLIEPLRHGPALVQEIESNSPRPGVIAIWWLGQSGFLIKSPRGLLGIDLYLSEHLTQKYAQTNRPHIRMTRAPIRGADLKTVDVILASHKHSDHLDPGTLPDLMVASPQARLILPAAIVDHALSLGLPPDRLVGIDAEQTITLAGFTIQAIPSAHETLETEAQGRHLFLGFLIETEGLRLYHTGDCVTYPGLADRLAKERLDVMFLPINGRDPARGVPGNMSAAEAVDLASICRPRLVVPHHYDMFTFNTVPVSDFEAEAGRLPAGVNPILLACGERVVVQAVDQAAKGT